MKQIERGLEPPAQFYERPEIFPYNQFYWEAFWDLSTERQIGMAAGPIPRSAIIAYAQEYDIVGDDFDLFYRMLRTMDGHYLTLSSPSSSKDVDQATYVAADDIDGVKAVIDRLRVRAKSATKKQKKEQAH
jgi:hypothetical protein